MIFQKKRERKRDEMIIFCILTLVELKKKLFKIYFDFFWLKWVISFFRTSAEKLAFDFCDRNSIFDQNFDQIEKKENRKIFGWEPKLKKYLKNFIPFTENLSTAKNINRLIYSIIWTLFYATWRKFQKFKSRITKRRKRVFTAARCSFRCQKFVERRHEQILGNVQERPLSWSQE